MFSVPGWSLSAPLKTQTEPIANSIKRNSLDEQSAKSRKRKRSERNTEANGEKVTRSNVGELWERHVGAKASEKEVAKESPKKSHSSPGDDDQLTNQDQGETATQLAVDGSAKKKKRRSKNKKTKDSNAEEVASKDPEVLQGAATTSKSKSSISQTTSQPISSATTKLTPLQASMRAKLTSARFRHLNETLYTTPSSASLLLFTQNPEMFAEYHAGFRQQVEVWPENPVDGYIAEIRRRAKIRPKFQKHPPHNRSTRDSPSSQPTTAPLPRTRGTSTIADIGCGDARLAQSLEGHAYRLGLALLSFDLHADDSSSGGGNSRVRKADAAALPLPDGAVDVAIFCLALMGTNWPDFVDEAYRVLRWKGELWIAEIKSRFGRAAAAAAASSSSAAAGVKAGGGGNRVVDHSVGKRRKMAAVVSPADRRKALAAEERVNEDALTVEVDGEANGTSSSNKGPTDVRAFVSILRRRGFVLDGDEQSAVDMSNKMFVKMRFVKAARPSRGKNVEKENQSTAPAHSARPWDRRQRQEQQQQQQQQQQPKLKYLEDLRRDEGNDVDEASILKPCLYKLR